MRLMRLVGFGLVAGVAATSGAQSFNVDLDIFFGNSQVGNGAPSSGFGGAANDPGYWNRFDAGGYSDPKNLFGLDGSLTSVQLLATGGLGSSGGYNNSSNTGDYALLMNDFVRVNSEIDFHFTGLVPGQYDVYTYAVNPDPMRVYEQVTITGADDPIQYVSGPMPGNQFVQGVTHTVHDINLTGDSFVIQVSGPWPNSVVNGFQIVAVPEPASFLLLAAGLPVLLRRRTRN